MSASELLRHVDSFPTLPEVAIRVSRALEDPEVDLSRVAEMIELDATLAAQLVRMANSPIFGLGSPADSVRKALTRLGIKETRNAIVTVSLMRALPELPAPYEVRSFWVLGLASGMVARQLARDLKFPDPEMAYLAGLVHCLGEAYLAVQFTERVCAVVERWRGSGEDFEDHLTAEFDVEVPEISAGLLEAWNFPDPIVVAVRSHWHPERDPACEDLAGLILTADRLCRDVGLGVVDPGPQERTWIADVPYSLEDALTERGYPDLTYYLLELQDKLAEVREFASSVYA